MSFFYDLFDRGRIDKEKHDRRLREAIKRALPGVIAKEDIITAKGNKKVKITIRALDHWRFKYGKEGPGVGSGGQDVQPGDPIQSDAEGDVARLPGQDPGEQVYEEEFTLDEIINMMLEDLGLPFLEEKPRARRPETKHELLARSRKGEMGFLDRRRTFKEYLKRKVIQNLSDEEAVITNRDFRFKAFKAQQQEILNAVVFFTMDASGSMSEEILYYVKAFFFYLHRLLERKYEFVEKVFVTFDTQAYLEPSERDFFSRVGSGGTKVSSAFRLISDLTQDLYRPEDWNIYIFLFSDGENWIEDNPLVVEQVEKLLEQGVNLIGYGEITVDSPGAWEKLSHALSAIDHPRLVTATIGGKEDLYFALRKFLVKL